MNPPLKSSLGFPLAICLAIPNLLLAEPAVDVGRTGVRQEKNTRFIRVTHNDRKSPIALQTAVVRYVPRDGDGRITVDLVGAVHVGEDSYYQELNKLFQQYDALLYELVAPPDSKVPDNGRRRRDNPLSLLQSIPQTMLGLESQLENIDYKKDNFVHADMSPQQMADAMKARGDDAMTLALGFMADMLRQQNRLEQQRAQDDSDNAGDSDIDLAQLFDALGDPIRLKRMLAKQFTASGSLANGLGSTVNDLLIKDRNQAAMQVLVKEMAKGKKRIGIFYGAAHMADFQQRLSDLDFKKESQDWLTAWDLTANHARPLDAAGLFLDMLQQLEP